MSQLVDFLILILASAASCQKAGMQSKGSSPLAGGNTETVKQVDKNENKSREDISNLNHLKEVRIWLNNDLPDCNSSRTGTILYVVSESAFKHCSESTWLIIDLRGPRGETGPKGETGPRGEPGIEGTTTIVTSPNTPNRQLVLTDAGTSNFIALQAPNYLSSSINWELPATSGLSGQLLGLIGPGTLGWISATNNNQTDGLVRRDSLGNFAAGVISANVVGNVTGNLTGNASTATEAVSFSAPLAGDVIGGQNSTTVTNVGGVSAAAIAAGSLLANHATSNNLSSTIVKRDNSGNFSAGMIYADLTGHLFGNATTATTASGFSGSLAGDVTGNQAATVVSKIRGKNISSVAPQSGQALIFDGSDWSPSEMPVTKLQGRNLSGAIPAVGDQLTWSGTAWEPMPQGSSTSLPVTLKTGDFAVTSFDGGKYYLISGSITVVTLPSISSISTGFFINLKSKEGLVVVRSSNNDLIEGRDSDLAISPLSSALLTHDGNSWYVSTAFGTLNPSVLCDNNCYTNANALTLGYAYTISGRNLVLRNGVWQEIGGTNVLKVDGSDAWHLALTANGRSYQSNYLNSEIAKLAGRVCPSSVYVPNVSLAAANRCLYYDSGNQEQRLDSPYNNGTVDQTNTSSLSLGSTTAAASGSGATISWYEGNIHTCAVKGMRLPTLYESSGADPGGSFKPTDASPTFSPNNGVPSVMNTSGAQTWTASGSAGSDTKYWTWRGATSTSSPGTVGYSNSFSVRCVAP